MSEVKSNIQEVFGQFAVELADGAKLFPTHAEALAAETEYLKGAEFRNEAAAFCANQGIEGKNAKSKINILVAYFTWVESGRPERAVEDEAAADEAAADEVSTDADTGNDEVEF